MDFKDFIIGEKYNISALAIEGSFAAKKYAAFELPTGRTFLLRAEDFEAVRPENGIKNTETAPKYDPTRKFRRGDVVRVVERHGRYQPNIPWDELWKGLCTVAEDEDFCNNLVKVRSEDGREKLSHWWYLELVTPVEELEPYYVEQQGEKTGGLCFTVRKRNGYAESTFYFGACRSRDEQQAKAAAEAERARLNEEYRKEQSHD